MGVLAGSVRLSLIFCVASGVLTKYYVLFLFSWLMFPRMVPCQFRHFGNGWTLRIHWFVIERQASRAHLDPAGISPLVPALCRHDYVIANVAMPGTATCPARITLLPSSVRSQNHLGAEQEFSPILQLCPTWRQCPLWCCARDGTPGWPSMQDFGLDPRCLQWPPGRSGILYTPSVVFGESASVRADDNAVVRRTGLPSLHSPPDRTARGQESCRSSHRARSTTCVMQKVQFTSPIITPGPTPRKLTNGVIGPDFRLRSQWPARR